MPLALLSSTYWELDSQSSTHTGGQAGQLYHTETSQGGCHGQEYSLAVIKSKSVEQCNFTPL